MKRWAIAISISLLTALFAAFFVRAPNPRVNTPVDEILAYEIRADRSVKLEIPGDVAEISVTAWGVLEDSDAGLDDRFPFTVRAVLRDRRGTVTLTRNFANETRLDPRSATGDSFRARLLDTGERALDPRTISVLTEGKIREGGTLELGVEPGSLRKFLVRVLHKETRSPLEQAAYLRGLEPKAREDLVSGRSSLGYEDLPEAVRLRSVSTWGRRLEAVGKEGTDYYVRRLFIGTAPAPGRSGTEATGFAIDHRHALVFNFLGPVRLRVLTSSKTTLEGVEARSVSDDGTAFIVDDAKTGPHTISFHSSTSTSARVVVDEAGARAQIFDGAALPHPSGWELTPDVRSMRHIALDPALPARYRLPDGYARVVCRSTVDPAEEEKKGSVTLRFTGLASTSDLLLQRSMFDRWKDGADATLSVSRIVRPPKGSTNLEILGPSHMRCFAQVLDPSIQGDIYKLPYRVALRPDEHWVHAPFDLSRWATIWPENELELERAGRIKELRALVRIEPKAATGASLPKPEMVVLPFGQPAQRHFLEPAVLGRGFPLPEGAITRIDRGLPLLIEDKGARARHLNVSYVVPPASLGRTLSLFSDGKEIASERLVTTSGHLRASVEEGRHVISVQGSDGAYFADAAPADGGNIHKQHTVFELRPDRELYFRFPQPEGVLLTTWIYVVTNTLKEPWRLRYWLSGGEERRGLLLRSLTAGSGVLVGKNGDKGGGVLWEGDTPLSTELRQGIGRAQIRLGDDRTGGLRELRLRLEEPDRVWIRVVVVGEGSPTASQESAWITDDD